MFSESFSPGSQSTSDALTTESLAHDTSVINASSSTSSPLSATYYCRLNPNLHPVTQLKDDILPFLRCYQSILSSHFDPLTYWLNSTWSDDVHAIFHLVFVAVFILPASKTPSAFSIRLLSFPIDMLRQTNIPELYIPYLLS